MEAHEALEHARALREELGREVRRLRLAAGLTQNELAREAGYHRVSVTQVEGGRQDLSRDFVRRLEAVLHADGQLITLYERFDSSRSATQRTSAPRPRASTVARSRSPENKDDVNRRDLLRNAAAVGAAAALPGGQARPGPTTGAAAARTAEERKVLAALRQALLGTRLPRIALHQRPDTAFLSTLAAEVEAAWQLRQRGRYVDLGRCMPDLLASAQVAVQKLDGDERRKAHALYAHALNASSSALKKLGDTHLAALAADRSVQSARATEDPLLIASSAYRLANVFLPAGHLVETKEIGLSAAALLEPAIGTSRARLATWGSLVLTAAIAAAKQQQPAEAWELVGEAKAAARRIGVEHADLHTIFGPMSFEMQAVGIAAELGDSREVLRRARAVNTAPLPAGLLERRAQFLIDLARGHEQHVQDREAVATLLKAEQLTPEEIRHNAGARDLVVRLLARERRGAAPGLRELAGRVGLAA